jgi:hypothetical protein
MKTQSIEAVLKTLRCFSKEKMNAIKYIPCSLEHTEVGGTKPGALASRL